MTFEIEQDGTRRRVTVRQAGDAWVVEIDGREVEVSVVERAGRWSMLVGPVDGPAKAGHDNPDVVSGFSRTSSYEVAFEPGAGGELIVHVNGVAVPVTIDQPGLSKPWAKAARQRRGRGAGDGATGDAPRTIVAPMPGRIVKVLVKPDEVVTARQPLVVVEAMKMENELRAPRAGIVAEVRVAEGASVEANTVLVVLR